jgi:hypothetical protein
MVTRINSSKQIRHLNPSDDFYDVESLIEEFGSSEQFVHEMLLSKLTKDPRWNEMD